MNCAPSTMFKHLRIFFAIPLSEEIKNSLAELIQKLQTEPWAHAIRWGPVENLHVTLRFIGSCNLEQIPSLINNVKTAINKNPTISPFSIQLKELQFFPSTSKPKIISIKVESDPALFQLAHSIEQGVLTSGFVAEKRPYSPHLTLGRLKYSRIIPIPKLPSLNTSTLWVDHFVLFKSEQVNRNSHYEGLETLLIS